MDESGKQNVDESLSDTERIVRLTEQLDETRRELETERTRRQTLEQQHREDLRRIAELERVAIVDPLTGLLNRRGANAGVGLILDERRAILESPERRKKNSDITVLVLDIDHFKLVNDTYGHDAGDAVLKAVAERLQQGFRKGDLVIRKGGEEITCILPGVDARTAYHLLFKKFGNADREFAPGDHPQINFLLDIEDTQGNMVPLQVTFSGGIMNFEQGSSLEETEKIADTLLYKAKEQGRNRILMPEPADATEGK